MKLLLDTSFLIDVLRDRKGRRKLLFQLVGERHEMATASVNVGEIYSGLWPSEEEDAQFFLAGIEVLNLNSAIARRAGRLRYAWARQGRTLGLPDMIVAATALEYDLTVVTDNRKDFPMPELKLFDLP